ncbi:hypothetical protein BT96DRAFT_1007989 [Gymnopus androsaceus JB14]|uniref:RRM domain-containing protein n=1 Tax=Gymnopus androsaceus JB14 TaxID=1447944 RepID=A0A6A4GG38_9AGAR|nr:hypothetical protein BT96DRAFT_1007989 [Gymnopus androsaceus JB14]
MGFFRFFDLYHQPTSEHNVSFDLTISHPVQSKSILPTTSQQSYCYASLTDPRSEPSSLSQLSFAHAITLCPNLHALDISLYGCVSPGNDIVGSLDTLRMRRPAPSFDEAALALLKEPSVYYTGRTVYVGNLPSTASVHELLNLVHFGPLESIRVLLNLSKSSQRNPDKTRIIDDVS